jgi:hypothetical protein
VALLDSVTSHWDLFVRGIPDPSVRTAPTSREKLTGDLGARKTTEHLHILKPRPHHLKPLTIFRPLELKRASRHYLGELEGANGWRHLKTMGNTTIFASAWTGRSAGSGRVCEGPVRAERFTGVASIAHQTQRTTVDPPIAATSTNQASIRGKMYTSVFVIFRTPYNPES